MGAQPSQTEHPLNISGNRAVPLLIVMLLTPACQPVEGGAVEIRWDIRNVKGERIGCDGDSEDPGARQVLKMDRLYFQLKLIPTGGGDDVCLLGDDCRFECTTGTSEILPGNTPFTIPEGEYLMTSYAWGYLSAKLPEQHTAMGDVVAPPPVQRQVAEGEITDLNVNLIIVRY
jgi:hypothetical protein